jgi:hypothetical protein
MTRVFLALLLFSSLVLAAGTVEAFPDGLKWHQARLAQVRKENLQAGVRGPLATRVLRYRDVWKGKKRTFVWSAQKFENPDGTIAYAVVMTELLPDGKQKLMMAGGSMALTLVDGGEEEPRYEVVYRAVNAYIRQHKLEDKF